MPNLLLRLGMPHLPTPIQRFLPSMRKPALVAIPVATFAATRARLRDMALTLVFGLGLMSCGTAFSQMPLPGNEPAAEAGAPVPPLEPDAAAYLAELQARARSLGVAGSTAWRDLLHFKRHPLTRQLRSLADDPGFFLAATGTHDAQAELDASLAAFFDPTPRHAQQQSAQCRFRARYEHLQGVLSIDAARLPPQPCPRFEQWRAGLNPRSVSMVFPAAYVNSPASMYGHTFLRLNADGPAADQPLLAYAISYAAAGNEAEGLAFALKGLLGLYPGIFTNSPYYLRIRDYTHLENRDIWEYELNLAPHEIERLLAHTWELGFTRFDYYFFDENCSYHLLSLLDVARPGLGLTDQFTWWAIPVDTVRATVEAEGLLAGRRFRPSNSTELMWRASQLPPPQVAQARALGEGRVGVDAWRAEAAGPGAAGAPRQPLGENEQARTLELAERYLSYRVAQGRVPEATFNTLRLQLLGARAALSPLPDVVVPEPAVPPEAGHGTARIDLAAGRRGDQGRGRITLRPAYHDLMDPEAGYSRGAQIQFGHIELDWIAGRGLSLARFTPVDIVSLNPSNELLGGTSWKVRFGRVRSFAPMKSAGAAALQDPGPALELNGGPGKAWELGDHQRALAYVYLDNQAWRDSALPDTPWAVGSGLQAGLLLDPLPAWRLQIEAAERHFIGQAPRERSLLLKQRWSLGLRHNLSAECAWRRRGDGPIVRECLVGLQTYR